MQAIFHRAATWGQSVLEVPFLEILACASGYDLNSRITVAYLAFTDFEDRIRAGRDWDSSCTAMEKKSKRLSESIISITCTVHALEAMLQKAERPLVRLVL